MTTRVINLRGRIHEYGPRLELAPPDLVYVGRHWTLGGWHLPRHPLYNPFAYDTPTRRRDGTRAEVMAKYRAYLRSDPNCCAWYRSCGDGCWLVGVRRWPVMRGCWPSLPMVMATVTVESAGLDVPARPATRHSPWTETSVISADTSVPEEAVLIIDDV